MYTGSEILGTREFVKSLKTKVTHFTNEKNTHEYRVTKAQLKGYTVVVNNEIKIKNERGEYKEKYYYPMEQLGTVEEIQEIFLGKNVIKVELIETNYDENKENNTHRGFIKDLSIFDKPVINVDNMFNMKESNSVNSFRISKLSYSNFVSGILNGECEVVIKNVLFAYGHRKYFKFDKYITINYVSENIINLLEQIKNCNCEEGKICEKHCSIIETEKRNREQVVEIKRRVPYYEREIKEYFPDLYSSGEHKFIGLNVRHNEPVSFPRMRMGEITINIQKEEYNDNSNGKKTKYNFNKIICKNFVLYPPNYQRNSTFKLTLD